MIFDSTFISGWYAIFQSNRLTHKNPVGIMRFNLSLVLWRSMDGSVQCMLDRCPHRGAKLSVGKIKKDCIECPYHGFQFNTEGVCDYSPEFNKSILGLKVQKFNVIESMGMIWLYYGESSNVFDLKRLSDIHNNTSMGYCETSRIWNSHITYCIENQLDYTHLPEVHHNTIGRGFKYPEDPTFDLLEKQITISFDKEKTALEFFFPNTWLLNIGMKMKLIIYFSPIDDARTQLYLRTYNTMLKYKPIRSLLSFIFNKSNLVILKQDQRVVQSQGLGPSYLAENDLLMKNDKAIKYFRQYWCDHLDEKNK